MPITPWPRPIEPGTPTPQSWRAFVRERTGELPPLTMTDGRSAEFRDISGGYDPGDAVDRAIMATWKAIFPFHGLDPQL